MKTLVIFYSRGGNTKALAQQLAAQRGADLVEVKTPRPLSVVGAIFSVPASLGFKPGKIQPLRVDFTPYERVVVMGPIWASHPAAPLNNIFEMLPKAAQVELRLVSREGQSEKNRIMAHLKSLGLNVVEYWDIKTGPEQRQ